MTFPPEPFYFSLQYSQGHSLMSPSTSPFSTQGDLLMNPSTSPFYLALSIANSTFTNWPIVDLLILFYIIIFPPSTLSKKVSHEPFYFSLEHSQGDSLMSPSTSLSQWHSLYNPFYFSLQHSQGDSLCPSTSPFSALKEILFAHLLLPSALSGRFSLPFYFSLQHSQGDSLCPSTSPFSTLREILWWDGYIFYTSDKYQFK